MNDFIKVLNQYWALLAGTASIFFSIGVLYANMASNTRAIKKLFELYEKTETQEKAKERGDRLWIEIEKNHESNNRLHEEVMQSIRDLFKLMSGHKDA